MIQILIGCEQFVIFHCFNCIGIDAMLLQLACTFQQNWKVLTPPVAQKLSVRWHIVNIFWARFDSSSVCTVDAQDSVHKETHVYILEVLYMADTW
jgi:hypothetical protein